MREPTAIAYVRFQPPGNDEIACAHLVLRAPGFIAKRLSQQLQIRDDHVLDRGRRECERPRTTDVRRTRVEIDLQIVARKPRREPLRVIGLKRRAAAWRSGVARHRRRGRRLDTSGVRRIQEPTPGPGGGFAAERRGASARMARGR